METEHLCPSLALLLFPVRNDAGATPQQTPRLVKDSECALINRDLRPQFRHGKRWLVQASMEGRNAG